MNDAIAPEARVFFEQGCQLAQHHSTIQQAARAFNQAIEINPHYALAYFELGRMYYTYGWHHEAIKPMEKAIELNPSFPAYMNLGLNFNLCGKHKDAENVFRKALEFMPDHGVALYELGFAILMTSFYNPDGLKEAITHFHKALEKQPDYKNPVGVISDVLVFHLKDHDAALSFANEIQETFPDRANHIRHWVGIQRNDQKPIYLCPL